MLPQAGYSQRSQTRYQRYRHAAIDGYGVEGAIAQRPVDGELVARLHGVDLYDTGRRVTPEQGALRAAKNLDPFDVENREGLQRHVFHHHVVHDDGYGLRCCQIEIGIAQTADIEPRRRASVRAFDEQARDAGRKRGDFGACIEDRADRTRIQGRSRYRHVLEVLLTAVRGHDNRVELPVGGFFRARLIGGLRHGGLRSEGCKSDSARPEEMGGGGPDRHFEEVSCLSAQLG